MIGEDFILKLSKQGDGAVEEHILLHAKISGLVTGVSRLGCDGYILLGYIILRNPNGVCLSIRQHPMELECFSLEIKLLTCTRGARPVSTVNHSIVRKDTKQP